MSGTGIFKRFIAAVSLSKGSQSNRSGSPSQNSLRVGVSSNLARFDRTTGHGRVWSTGLEHLRRLASIVDDPGDYTSIHRPDVWLTDGHADAIAVPEPIVTLVHEARWVEPDLAADLDPAFLSAIAPTTAQAVRQATRVLTHSFASARNIAQLGVSADRIDVVPPGVDLNIFQPGLTGGRELVASRTNDDRPYIIAVASLFRGKNLPLLRRAVARLASRGFPHRLVLVTQRSGDGFDSTQALSELRTGAEPRPEVFENVTDRELAALIASSTAFCLPSRFEGFGLPALEALACGVPVIVSNGGALPEVVADAGLIVMPELDMIERALATVIEDHTLARTLALKGRQRAETFTWERTTEGWMRALTRAAEVRQ
jgi:glycosyltransferase involved in cell wall biosynthesis